MKRLCLAIETTGTHLGLSLHDLDAAGVPAVARFFEAVPGRQSDLLFPTLGGLLKLRRLRRDDIALVAVDHGPGSFTGVRVGVAAARGVAQSLGVPVVGVGSLEAMAWSVARGLSGDVEVAARIPALAGESYFAIFRRSRRGAWKAVVDPLWTTDAVVDGHLRKLARRGGFLALTRRANESIGVPDGVRVEACDAPDPSAIGELGATRAGARRSAAKFPLERVVPVYLQPSWAERSRK